MYDPKKPFIGKLLELIGTTWKNSSAYATVIEPDVIEKKFPVNLKEARSTDGIGTKGIYHWQQRSFKNAVLDALAMNLNDLALHRARAYELRSHIMLPEEDSEAIYEIVSRLAEECIKRNIVISGGETSIHDDFGGLEISVTVNGFIENPKENKFRRGDSLVGIASSGLHSNGFTDVRRVLGNLSRKEFIEPTLIYYDAVLDLDSRYDISGVVHITGGAFTKPKPYLSGNDLVINNTHWLNPQEIFYELRKNGRFTDKEMYRTFNCGIGFIMSVSPEDAENVVSDLSSLELRAKIIGRVVPGTGKVKIKSMFSQGEVIL